MDGTATHASRTQLARAGTNDADHQAVVAMAAGQVELDRDAGRMWRSLRASALLTGYRGSEPVDTAAVEDLLPRLGSPRTYPRSLNSISSRSWFGAGGDGGRRETALGRDRNRTRRNSASATGSGLRFAAWP